jgi:hypothetical protein
MDKATHRLVYDLDLKQPACAILQAAMGGEHLYLSRHFTSDHWLVQPTPGMKLMEASDEQWKKVAEITKRRLG